MPNLILDVTLALSVTRSRLLATYIWLKSLQVLCSLSLGFSAQTNLITTLSMRPRGLALWLLILALRIVRNGAVENKKPYYWHSLSSPRTPRITSTGTLMMFGKGLKSVIGARACRSIVLQWDGTIVS